MTPTKGEVLLDQAGMGERAIFLRQVGRGYDIGTIKTMVVLHLTVVRETD